jgi:hypothetical protein
MDLPRDVVELSEVPLLVEELVPDETELLVPEFVEFEVPEEAEEVVPLDVELLVPLLVEFDVPEDVED